MPLSVELRNGSCDLSSRSGPNDSDSLDPLTGLLAENIPTMLPSSMKPSIRERVCIHSTVDLERRLRAAQAEDALIELRRLRRIYQGLSARLRKTVWGVGQTTNTRSRSILQGFVDKLTCCKLRYRAAYSALLTLDPGGSWSTYLLELKDEDIRGPGKDEEEEVEFRVRQQIAGNDVPTSANMKGKRRRKQEEHLKSWIWITAIPSQRQLPTEDMSDSDLNDQVRAEWAKTHARAERWAEEVDLLVEEMRRTLAWLEWKADWWTSQSTRRGDVDPYLANGLTAYAHKQAAILQQQAVKFAASWIPILRKNDLGSNWCGTYEKLFAAHKTSSIIDATPTVANSSGSNATTADSTGSGVDQSSIAASTDTSGAAGSTHDIEHSDDEIDPLDDLPVEDLDFLADAWDI
jgi:hypothetical protein